MCGRAIARDFWFWFLAKKKIKKLPRRKEEEEKVKSNNPAHALALFVARTTSRSRSDARQLVTIRLAVMASTHETPEYTHRLSEDAGSERWRRERERIERSNPRGEKNYIVYVLIHKNLRETVVAPVSLRRRQISWHPCSSHPSATSSSTSRTSLPPLHLYPVTLQTAQRWSDE